MSFRKDLEEAAAILDGMLELLLRSATSKSGREAYELRARVGELQADTETAVVSPDIGTRINACFDAALAAGATLGGIDEIRRYLITQETKAVLSDAVVAAGAVMCLGCMGELIAGTTFRSRDDVQAMIVYMRGALDPMKEVAADSLAAATYHAINKLGSTIMRHLARTELQLPQRVTYRAAIPLPSLRVAYGLYQDAERSDEIVAENKIVHPAFCPIELRVLAR